MSTMNVIYPTKILIKELIKKVFDRVYNQLPLSDVKYPFAVYELSFRENSPGMKLELLVDLWGNELSLTEFTQKSDDLIRELDRINNSENNGSVHFSGSVDIVRDVPTQEENLNRIQIIGTYDLYKVTA
jgi:hypothetical protein